MLPPRLLLLFLLFLLLLLTPGRAAERLRGSGPRAEGRRGGPQPQRAPVGFTGHAVRGAWKAGRSNPERQLIDPRHKEKIISILTGPLYIKPRCRKQFHRLYHSTRDCTVPNYFKRCARLLTQLARSPRCAQRKTDDSGRLGVRT